MSQQRRRAEQVQAAFAVNCKKKPDRLRAKRAALGQLEEAAPAVPKKRRGRKR